MPRSTRGPLPRPNPLTRRRFLGYGAAAAGAVSFGSALTACGADGAAKGSASKELTFMNQSRGQKDALAKLTKTYEEQTGVRVTVDNVGPVDFPTKLQSKSQSGDMPDIYSALLVADMIPYYKAGWALDLSSELKGDWKKNFAPTAVELATIPAGNANGVQPGIYSAHWEIQLWGLFRNTASFKEAGVDPAKIPATTAEWIDQLKTISKHSGNGAYLVAASLSPYLLQTHAANWLTDDEISATFAGKAPWTTDGWRKALQLIPDLVDAGVIVNRSIPGGNDDNPTVEKSFFNVQDAASIFDASVAVGVGRATAPDFTDYTSTALPAAPDATQKPRVVGNVGKGACINPKGKNVEAALAFVKWLTEPDQAKVFADMVGLVPANPTLKSDELAPQSSGLAEHLDNIQVIPAPFSSDARTAMSSGVQALALKEKTVDQVLAQVQAAQKKSK
jgi:raffinose/stachyose/melibiose transport system substrate-binding protein